MKISKILIACAAVAVLAQCRKPEEQTRPDAELTRKYCNDPRAINYNDSFPGIPDNAQCRYPDEQFDGVWSLTDSVFRADSTFFDLEEKEIRFQAISDTGRNKIALIDWCGTPIQMKANRYGRAEVVNTLSYPDSAQVACGTDSLMGFVKFRWNTVDTLDIFMSQKPETGTKYYHKATAIRK